MREVQRALAVACQYDRAVFLDFCHKFIKSQQNVLIRGVECLLAFWLCRQKRTNCGLTVARGPHFASARKRGCKASQEKPGTVLRFCVIEGRVPIIPADIRRWMHKKYSGRPGYLCFSRTSRQPICWIANFAGTGEPHIIAPIFARFKRRLLFKFGGRDKGKFCQFAFINADNETARNNENDERCDDV